MKRATVAKDFILNGVRIESVRLRTIVERKRTWFVGEKVISWNVLFLVSCFVMSRHFGERLNGIFIFKSCIWHSYVYIEGKQASSTLTVLVTQLAANQSHLLETQSHRRPWSRLLCIKFHHHLSIIRAGIYMQRSC